MLVKSGIQRRMVQFVPKDSDLWAGLEFKDSVLHLLNPETDGAIITDRRM